MESTHLLGERKESIFMQRALQLSAMGRGKVSPNPMVGCVVVLNGKVIGEGYHQAYGGPHAEVNALAAIPKSTSLAKATAYVTLEPCSHFGKTPPCADLLIERKVGCVVVACTDPNPKVAGRGIDKLKKAGIEVICGMEEASAKKLNARFFTQMLEHRPYIILKWAETADGFIARSDYSSKWISNWLSRTLVHKWRAEEDAVMVATNTALYDNPELTAREWPTAKQPLRITIDRNLRLPENLKLFDGKQPTLCFNTVKNGLNEGTTFVKVSPDEPLKNMMTKLLAHKVQSVLVEGGRQLLNALINEGLWDEARVFKSSQSFGKGIAAPTFHGHLLNSERILDDQLNHYRPIKVDEKL